MLLSGVGLTYLSKHWNIACLASARIIREMIVAESDFPSCNVVS